MGIGNTLGMVAEQPFRARLEEALEIAVADHDVRYVPQEGLLTFCAVAHETRYIWLMSTFPVRGKSILDFGCGSGYGARMMAEAAQLVHGIDSSQRAIMFARRFYARDNLEFFNVDACCSDDLFCALRRDSYDMVVSFDVIEHVEKYFDYLANVCQLMKEEGLFVLSTPNRLQTFNWNPSWNPYHFQEFSAYQLRKVLSMYFEDVSLIAQDFQDDAKREMVRAGLLLKRTVREFKPLSKIIRKTWRSIRKRMMPATYQKSDSIDYSDIMFLREPGDEALGRAFGLVAVCRRRRRVPSTRP